MIDCTFELHTADDTVVFHRWLNFSPNHDSMVGEQSISFQIPKHLLNTGKYYFRIFFGENEAHLMWGDLIYNFEVEFTEEKVGDIIVGSKPGIIRPELNFKHEILG
jgi:lipopolysaccharide transport system ATP-binding protein